MKRPKQLTPLIQLTAALALSSIVSAADAMVTEWNGFQLLNFSVAETSCFITQPAVTAPGKPWVWCTSFPDDHAEVDLELLRNGWAVAYIECLDKLARQRRQVVVFVAFSHVPVLQSVRRKWRPGEAQGKSQSRDGNRLHSATEYSGAL